MELKITCKDYGRFLNRPLHYVQTARNMRLPQEDVSPVGQSLSWWTLGCVSYVWVLWMQLRGDHQPAVLERFVCDFATGTALGVSSLRFLTGIMKVMVVFKLQRIINLKNSNGSTWQLFSYI